MAVEDVPASYGDEDAVAPWEIYPAHTAFYLNGYPLQDTFFSAHIMIFPVGECRSMSSQAGSVVDDLQQYLTYGSLTVGEHIPFFHCSMQPNLSLQKSRNYLFRMGRECGLLLFTPNQDRRSTTTSFFMHSRVLPAMEVSIYLRSSR